MYLLIHISTKTITIFFFCQSSSAIWLRFKRMEFNTSVSNSLWINEKEWPIGLYLETYKRVTRLDKIDVVEP